MSERIAELLRRMRERTRASILVIRTPRPLADRQFERLLRKAKAEGRS